MRRAESSSSLAVPAKAGISPEEHSKYRSHMRTKAQQFVRLNSNDPSIQWLFVEDKKSVTISKAILTRTSSSGERSTYFLMRGVTEVQADLLELLDLLSPHTTESFKRNYKSIFPDFIDGQCLQTLDVPTSGHPYRSLSLKWAAYECKSGNQRHNRDFVYLEFCNLYETRDKNCVGIIVMESSPKTEFNALVPRGGFIRGQIHRTGFILQEGRKKDTTLVTYICQERFIGGLVSISATETELKQRILSLSELTAVIERKRLSACTFVSQEHWVPDDRRSNCNLCRKPFNKLLRSRHHCRSCGEVVCAGCAPEREVEIHAIGITKVRVCTACILEIRAHTKDKFMGERIRRTSSNPAEEDTLSRFSKAPTVDSEQDARSLMAKAPPSEYSVKSFTGTRGDKIIPSSATLFKTAPPPERGPMPPLRKMSLKSKESFSTVDSGKELVKEAKEESPERPMTELEAALHAVSLNTSAAAEATAEAARLAKAVGIPTSYPFPSTKRAFSYLEKNVESDRDSRSWRGSVESVEVSQKRRSSRMTEDEEQWESPRKRSYSPHGNQIENLDDPRIRSVSVDKYLEESPRSVDNQEEEKLYFKPTVAATSPPPLSPDKASAKMISQSKPEHESATGGGEDISVEGLKEEVARLRRRAEEAESQLQHFKEGPQVSQRPRDEARKAVEEKVYTWHRRVGIPADDPVLLAKKHSHRQMVSELHELMGISDQPEEPLASAAPLQSPLSSLEAATAMRDTRRQSNRGSFLGLGQLEMFPDPSPRYEPIEVRPRGSRTPSGAFEPRSASSESRLRASSQLSSFTEYGSMDSWATATRTKLTRMLREVELYESSGAVIRVLKAAATVLSSLMDEAESQRYLSISRSDRLFKKLEGADIILEHILYLIGYEAIDEERLALEVRPPVERVVFLKEIIDKELDFLQGSEEELLL